MRIVKRNAGFELRRKRFRPVFVVEKKLGDNKYEEVFRGDIDTVRGWFSSRIPSSADATIYSYEDFEMNHEIYRVIEKPIMKGQDK